MSNDGSSLSGRSGATRAAWRRWEMHEVGDSSPRPSSLDTSPPPPPVTPEPAEPDGGDLDLLLEQLQDQAREQGHTQGYEAGFAQGQEAGHEQGHAAGFQAGMEQALEEQNRRAAQLDGLLQSAESALEQLNTQVAQGLVDLALHIARHVVQITLNAQPESLVHTVRELLQPQEGQLSWIRIRIHPSDHELLEQYFRSLPAPPPWQLLHDDTLTPGGCVLETSLGEIDATLQTRWARVAGSLATHAPAWQESK